MKTNSKLSWISISLLFLSPVALSVPLSLETTPLFTTNSVKPNLILAIDDSGSMDGEVLFSSNDGALWWNTSTSAQTFVSAPGQVNFNTSGSSDSTWKKYVYLFPNGTGADTGKRVYSDDTNHFAIPPLKQYAFARSSVYNKMYYDPNSTYVNWAAYGSTTFPNIPAASAPSDPISGTSTTLDLLSNTYKTGSNEKFKMYPGMKIPAGTYYDGVIAAFDTAITGDVSIRYYPASYYINKNTGTYTVGTGGSATAGNCASPNSPHYTLFHNEPSSLVGINIDSLGPDGQCLQKIEIKSATTSYTNSGTRTDCAVATNCTFDEEKQNFANWYAYYRKRHLALRAGMGQAFVGFSAIRTGIFTINSRNNVTMWDMSSASNSFYSKLYSIGGNSGGTPNREAMDYAGQQFMRTDTGKPIIESCQKNFTLLFTDGYATTSTNLGAGNQDSGKGVPYQDSYSNTLADISMKYFETKLRTDLTAGKVPPALGCSTTPIDPRLDCKTNLHMNTYTVGLGATGTIFGVSHFNVADAYTTPPAWPDVNLAGDATQVDDLYHAAVNGRGEMFNAASASDLQDKLKSALLGIQASKGSASAVTFNTSTLETNSAIYFAFFNSANWSGDLMSFPLNSQGKVSLSEAWSAATVLNSGSPVTSSTRKIITYNGSLGIPFRWDTTKLSITQQNDLNISIGSVGSNGQKLLNFIRGDRTTEGPGKYRVRSSALGDIVNSNPVFVGIPGLNWPSIFPFPTTVGSRYSDFRSNLLIPANKRKEIVYVGANDGMLHGFDANDGQERLAYIPNFLFSASANSGLHYLADPLYAHNYYVDLAPTVSDVYIDTGTGDKWHTLLIGGSRAGGRGLFALDITDPDTFSEANAAKIALWEFTDPELGYTYSKPSIAMMNNGKWAAIFGNGYNDNGTGKAKLFIVYLKGGLDGTWTPGIDYQIISTDVGSTTTPNGLSTPTVVDLDNNGTADRAYAGDLQGNLWAFDLTGLTTYSVAYNTSGTPTPLFVAKDLSGNTQPITSKPVVSIHPSPPTGGNHEPNLLVFFGTGKYLESSDLSSTAQQTFYGVWDEGKKGLLRNSLVAQTFDVGSYVDAASRPLRLISDNTVNYKSNGDHGWYIDLPASGERLVVEPQIRGSLIFFNTWIPSASACDSGGKGFLMSVEMLNGGEPDAIAFDTNGLAGITSGDYIIDSNGILRAAAGQSFDNGLPARSSFLSNKQYTPGTGDTLIEEREVQEITGPAGRFSWQEKR